MKKILSTLILFFFVSAAHSATPLVEASWLKENINNKNVKVIEICLLYTSDAANE